MKKNSLDANASIYDDMCWGQSGSNVANIWQSVDGFGGSSRGNRGFGKNRADLNDFNPNQPVSKKNAEVSNEITERLKFLGKLDQLNLKHDQSHSKAKRPNKVSSIVIDDQGGYRSRNFNLRVNTTNHSLDRHERSKPSPKSQVGDGIPGKTPKKLKSVISPKKTQLHLPKPNYQNSGSRIHLANRSKSIDLDTIIEINPTSILLDNSRTINYTKNIRENVQKIHEKFQTTKQNTHTSEISL